MTPKAQVFDERRCTLGEGAFWHPTRNQLFWFDIVNNLLLSRRDDTPLTWRFAGNVSAAGWIDRDWLLIAGETGLSRFNIETGTGELLCEIEADNPLTRSNDGRADPWGGFWVGTMGKQGEPGQGALYRWFQGECRVLETGMTTPNAICFDHARSVAYYSDTKTRLIWRQPLAPATGWPDRGREIFLDLRARDAIPERKPDGAVIDAEGCLWNAQWGSARVARYSPEGPLLATVDLPTGHTSCPVFGGVGNKTLYVTTATQKLPADRPEWQETAGQTFQVASDVSGLPAPRVRT